MIGFFAFVLPAYAEQPAVSLRFAAHPGFDRLALTLPPGASFTTQQEGTRLVVALAGVGHVKNAILNGHGLATIRKLATADGKVTLDLAPGAQAHVWRMGDRLIVDVAQSALSALPVRVAQKTVAQRADVQKTGALKSVAPGNASVLKNTRKVAVPPAAAGDPRLLVPLTAPPAPPVSVASLPAAPSAVPAPPPAAAAPQVARRQIEQPGLPPLPQTPSTPFQQGAAVTLLADEVGPGHGAAILVPMARDAGAAAFRHGGEAHVIFDVATPLDLSQLKDDPVFGSVTERLLPDGMHLQMHLAAGAALNMTRRSNGWVVMVDDTGKAKLAGIGSTLKAGKLNLEAAAPGRVVVLEDEVTGGRLLIGTQQHGGQRMAAPHRSAEFSVLPTWQGVVIEPISDRLNLRVIKNGFELSATDQPSLSPLWQDNAPGSLADGRSMTRRFDLPNLPAAELHNRLGQALRDAASTPRPARYAPRLRVVQAMLAEGLDVEAASVLQAALSDDPAHHDDPDAAGLGAIASWLSAQAGGGATPPLGFDPQILGTSDEAVLWRALWRAQDSDVSQPASALAAAWPLLLDYPAPLRRFMVPAAAAILARGGQDAALANLLASFPGEPTLALARAGLLKRQGKLNESLALLDQVAASGDRLMRSQALEEAVEDRLAAKQLNAAEAAAALEKQFYAWRGGDREKRLRLRVAQLQAQSGAWRAALAMLKETDVLYPNDHDKIHGLEAALLADLLRGDNAAQLSALDLVTLADEAAPLLTASDADEVLAPLLVDKLLSLDLSARAEPILKKLFDEAPAGPAKAGLGVRLAGLMSDRGDRDGALAVIGMSDDDGLPPDTALSRGTLRAQLLALSGKPDAALDAISHLGGPKIVDLRAKIQEDRHDWAGAAQTIDSFQHESAFAALSDAAQKTWILRAVRDSSEAGDKSALRRLRSTYGARFARGPDASLFAVLTADPVQTVSDLPRAGQELSVMRGAAGALK